jgi:hypothetical protein
MTAKVPMTQVEAFVRSVLATSFKQHVDDETVRAVAKKVSRAIKIPQPVVPKRAA